jgi:hypothetical protein
MSNGMSSREPQPVRTPQPRRESLEPAISTPRLSSHEPPGGSTGGFAWPQDGISEATTPCTLFWQASVCHLPRSGCEPASHTLPALRSIAPAWIGKEISLEDSANREAVFGSDFRPDKGHFYYFVERWIQNED